MAIDHAYLILFGGLERFWFFHILGMSSSQLTNSIIFQRGRSTTSQYAILATAMGKTHGDFHGFLYVY